MNGKQLAKFILNFRRLSILGFLACISLLIGSYIIENFLYVIPCQLCILQRGIFYLLTILFLLAAIHNPKNIGRYLYAFKGIVFASCGIILASRQIWLQHLPLEQVPECAPGLETLLTLHPVFEVLKIIFTGTSECYEIHFSILGLPLSNWSLLGFIGFLGLNLFIIYSQKKRWI